jgi:hypothetical protein
VALAADLTRAGYRCLTAGDPEAALWFAVKFSLETVPALYPGIVLVSPGPFAAGHLPPTVAWVDSSQADGLVEAVRHASRTQCAQLARMRPHTLNRTLVLVPDVARVAATGSACS